MEEKQFDAKSIIGYILLVGIAIWFFYVNKPSEEELAAEKAKQEQVEAAKTVAAIESKVKVSPKAATDSLGKVKAYQELGAFGFSQTLASANGGETVLENEVLRLKINNKGGYISEAKLKDFKTYDSLPVYLIKDGENASLGLTFNTRDNRVLDTKDLFFEPTLTKVGGNQQLAMRLKVSDDQYLEYVYTLKPNEYMLDFAIRSNGLSQVWDTSKEINLNWELEALRHAKSNTFEDRYTKLYYEYEGTKDNNLGISDYKEKDVESVSYVAYRQHFFSSILLTNTPFEKTKLTSKKLIEDEDIDTLKLKKFTLKTPLVANSGDLNYAMNWYYGPTDYNILNGYDKNLDEVVDLGWGIFGSLNKYVFMPLFNALNGFLPAGIAIILMTILVRLAMSPINFKQYLSQAKMKVLKPEINAVNEKYKDNAMKKQQETMAIYSKAGVNPMAGCIPALLQMPVFYALFSFFPTAIQLRQKAFMWVDDLSSYDIIAELPFKIPFYGDHISLLPIIASAAMFFNVQLTSGQTMQQPQQPGMPNMKFMMYLSPVFLLFFYNNFSSGLSLYYSVSYIITIAIMLVIKHFILDEDKIHAKIEANKKKPKKKSKFKQRLEHAMKEAEKQQKLRNK